MLVKVYTEKDVYTSSCERLEEVFDNFEKVYVSFSGGKDSSAVVQLALEIAKKKNKLPLHVLHIDLEGWYKHTSDFIERIMTREDVVPHWICLPLHLRNAVSQIQSHWLCWDPDEKENWIRPMPICKGIISDEFYFPWFRRGMEFEEFVPLWAKYFADGKSCACVVAIRSDESLNRFRTIASTSKTQWNHHQWTTVLESGVVNVYPIYDWKTEDVWTAHGKFHWDFNRVYDLMYLAGLPLSQMRLCQPFGDDQRKGLWLFKMLEPETWVKVVSRVQGANFGNRYVELSGNVFGNIKIKLPEGHTWKSYAEFLLETMPKPTAEHYKEKIGTFIKWWRKKEGYEDIPDEADPKEEASKKAPSWRRICKVILKNDYWCKGLSFAQTKKDMERQLELITRFTK